MKNSHLFKQSNYLFRTAIEREQKQFIKIAFAVHLSAVISAERYRSDSGALKSAVLSTSVLPCTDVDSKFCISKTCKLEPSPSMAELIFVYFYIIMTNKIEQSAAQSCLNKKLSLSKIPTDRTFENRRSRYKELGKKVPQAYRVYVEDTFLPCDAGDARIFSKEETGLYYYGARYLDPKYSRWLSGDPALGDYIPKAPIDDEAKKHNENLPGMGGIYNTVNLHIYHYAGNNPIKYIDPDGRDIILLNRSYGAGGFGHNAVLIGNDTDGWYYYSKDGKADGNQNGIRFDNLNAFRQANNKVVGKNNEYGASFNYDKGYQLKTTPEEDAQMQAYAAGRVNKDYSLFAENTEQFLDFSGGWKQRPSWKSIALEDNKAENCADFSGKVIEFGSKGAFFPSIFGATIPNTQYKNFKNAHPKGKILNFNPLPPGEYNYEKVDRMYEYMYGL